MSKLLALGARSLFIGKAPALVPHTNAVSFIAFGIDGNFRAGPGSADAPRGRDCRSVLIPAGTLHHLDCGDTTMAFLFVDSLSVDDAILRRLPAQEQYGFRFEVAGEDRMIGAIRQLASSEQLQTEDAARILDLLGINHARTADPRIAESVALLAGSPAAAHSLAELARSSGLSPSRYLHLFKQTTGVTLRRYRLWMRVGAAVRALSRGGNLTDAALGAGFASSSHFSTTYRAMFGAAPSELLRSGVVFRKPGASKQDRA